MSNPTRTHARLAVELLEDRTTPTFLTRPYPESLTVNGVRQEPPGGLSIASGDLLPDAVNAFGFAENEYVTGTGPGRESLVRVFSRDGTLLSEFSPFPGFQGGVNVAVGDVLSDGRPEIIVGVAAKGPPHVKVFSPYGQLLSSFYAFDPGFMGGVNVASGNVLGGIAGGGFTGGLVSSQFKSEIIIGAANGTAPHVVVTDASGNYLRSFYAFDPTYRGGVTVAAASMDSGRAPGFVFGAGLEDTNSYDEVIVGAATFAPHVKVFSVWQGVQTELKSFYAFDPATRQGVTLAAGSTDTTHGAEIFVSLLSTSTVRVFNGETGEFAGEFSVYPPNYSRVINMVVEYLTPPFHDPSDDDTLGGDSFDFDTKDLAVVSGDGSFEQEPRYFIGRPGQPAGFGGPP